MLPLLYAEGFLLMGVFVTLYNYVSFRLEAPPYSLSQAMVGLVFLVYLLGSFSSAWIGGLASRLGRAACSGCRSRCSRWAWRSPCCVRSRWFSAASPLSPAPSSQHTPPHRAGSADGLYGNRAQAAGALPPLLLPRVQPARFGRRARLEHCGWWGIAGFTLVLTLTALVIGLRLRAIEYAS